MKKNNKITFLFSLFLLASLSLVLAGGSPTFNTFQGGVKYVQEGEQVNVPQETNVSAYINGIYSGSASVSSESGYTLVINGNTGDVGKTITFKVGGVLTDQSTTYGGMGIYSLNLTVDKTAPTITIGSYNHNPTNQDVTVTATTNEGTLNTASHLFTTNGAFTFTATDVAGNIGSTTVTITNIDKVVPNFTKADNLTIYNNASLSSDLIDASDSGAGLASLSIDANPSFSITSQGIVTNATALVKGYYKLTIIAADNAGNTKDTTIFLTILEPTGQYAQEKDVTISNSTTDVVLNNGSTSVEKIIVPSSISSDKEINLDMSSLLSGSNVDIDGDLVLERHTTSSDYIATIFAGTTISGTATWDGLLELPKVTTLTSSLGTVNAVIEIGSDARLEFSKAVKVVLGGMTGKKALWSNSTGTYSIVLCADATVTSAGSLASGECYLDNGTDLIVWTYHFTTFGAYTPTTTTTTSSGGGGGGGGSSCSTKWNCTEWSVCLSSGIQIRTCSYPTNVCKPTIVKPAETQDCNYTIPISVNTPAGTSGGDTTTSGGTPITGAAIGTGLTSAKGIGIAIAVVVVLVGSVLLFRRYSRKK